jgi:hypothetical protein
MMMSPTTAPSSDAIADLLKIVTHPDEYLKRIAEIQMRQDNIAEREAKLWKWEQELNHREKKLAKLLESLAR